MSLASLNPKKNTGDSREAFGAFVTDDQTARTLTGVAADYGWAAERVAMGGIANAVRSLTVVASPRLLVVDLSDSRDAREDIDALAEVCEPGTVVIAIGMVNDVTLYRDLIASGIQDYLLKPITADAMREAISAADAAMNAAAGAAETVSIAEHKTIAVLGVRGGIGASLVSTSLSWILAHEAKQNVALLDLDLHWGTGALTFDLEPGRGLVDALENPARVDGLFIERAIIKESDKLSILGAEAPITEAVITDPTALSHLRGALSGPYQAVVMDFPRHMVPTYGFLLAEATDIVVVSDLTLAATRDSIRLLALIATVAPRSRVHLVLNQGIAGSAEVSETDYEASIQRSIDVRLPQDEKSVVAAAKKGLSLPKAMPASKLTEGIRSLSAIILGHEQEAEESGNFWTKLLARKS